MLTYQQYLLDSAVPRGVIDMFLDNSQPTWAQFDSELGYILGNSLPRDGIDGSATISTVQSNGARTSHIYTDRPCRINTYGNSFTQCHQVSDGETWQEYLAAHFGEPVRNFGMGGYGVYQAYRRMCRTEQTEDSAKYVLFYIWGDDHLRSLMRCRHAVTYPWWSQRGGLAFHSNFWANLEMDIESGQFVEHPNRLPTPEALYKMCDPEFMLATLEDDLIVQLCAAAQVEASSLDVDRLDALAKLLGMPEISTTDSKPFQAWANQLKYTYGFAATRCIIEKAVNFCEERHKELLFVLLCPRATRQLLHDEARYDQEIADYLDVRGLHCFDMNIAHLTDYRDFSIPVEDYMRRYFIGHYSPAGNHFFAHSIKSTLVDWLDPKPITYRTDEEQQVDFKGYLPD